MKFKKTSDFNSGATWSGGKTHDSAMDHRRDVAATDIWGSWRKPGAAESWIGSIFGGVVSELNASVGVGGEAFQDLLPKSSYVSEACEVQEERQAALRIYSALSHLSSCQLVAGDRMVLIEGLLNDVAGSEEYAKAIPRALAVNSKKINQEAKAALLRYLALHEKSLTNSQLTSIFLNSAQDDGSVSALAAARALDDVADEGAAGSIAALLPRVQCDAARAVMQSTMERLSRGNRNDAFGTDA